jgi:hypothetical protein
MRTVMDHLRAGYAGLRYQLRERRIPDPPEGESRLIPAFDPTIPKGYSSYGPAARRKTRFRKRRPNQ